MPGICSATQVPGRDIPALTRIGQHGDGLLVVPGEHTDRAWLSARLEFNPLADPELQHFRVRSHLLQKAKAFEDPMVQVDELGFGQLVDIDCHADSRRSYARAGCPLHGQFQRAGVAIERPDSFLDGLDLRFIEEGFTALRTHPGGYRLEMQMIACSVDMNGGLPADHLAVTVNAPHGLILMRQFSRHSVGLGTYAVTIARKSLFGEQTT
jgi:hypothetical protein